MPLCSPTPDLLVKNVFICVCMMSRDRSFFSFLSQVTIVAGLSTSPPAPFVYFRFGTPAGEGKLQKDATSPLRPWLPPDPVPIPLSLHLFPTWLPLRSTSGGGGAEHTDNHTGGSSCDPDVLIPWSLVTLTGSETLAKWPPLVALPVPMLPRRKEGCGLLSSGAAHSLSPPQLD